MILRPFKSSDAPIILGWIRNQSELRMWSADRYPSYPPLPEDMVAMYASNTVFPLTAEDEHGRIVGHLILRIPDSNKPHHFRLGFIIVDSSLRGKGYGKDLVRCALAYAKETLSADQVSLGVFLNNLSAYRCYESVGFVVVGQEYYAIDGEIWPGVEMVYRV